MSLKNQCLNFFHFYVIYLHFKLVINYNLPESNEAYVHRIGRTGRANKKGVAVTLVKPNEEKIMSSIERHIKTKINKCEVPKMEDIVTTARCQHV